MKVTVLMPTFNASKYISEAIQSILNQTYKNFKFLIIDDGSTDKTEEIINSFDDQRIRYIKKQHTGLADTLNYGLKIAEHDWVARMDADDISHPRRLELQMNYLSEHKYIDWISSWYAVFDNNIEYIIKLPKDSKTISEKLVLTSSVCFPGSIFKKNMILKNGGFEGEVFEDYKLLLKIKDHCIFYNIQEILYFQRKHKNSLSRKDYEHNRKIIYNIQAPYFINLKDKFNLKNNKQVLILKGWREFIYGNKNKSRYYWNSLGRYIFLNPKIILMYILTFLSNKQFNIVRGIGFKLMYFYSPVFYPYKFSKFIK